MARAENGFVYLWALFAVALAGIVMAGVGQVWQVKAQREKEAQLLYVGEEFRKAIMSYYNTGTKQFPETLEELLQDKRLPNIKRHLRKIYQDPVTNTAEWGLIEESSPGNDAASNPNPASGNNPTPNANPAAGNNPVLNAQSTPGSGAVPGSNPTTGNSPAPSGAMPNSSPLSSNIDKRIVGVYSLSERKPIKKDKFPERYAKFSEAVTYRDWKFVYKPGDGGDSQKPAANQTKPSTAPGTSPGNSPFAPQSSSGTNASPFSSRPSSIGGTSPFAPQSSSTTNSPTPSSGFPAD
ncbi:MAG: hypothetical protein HRU77_10100 [Gammaproteobacteria bacterium]|nr:MAG: hypothetical protein HRU77_10100 [Gammaproteobacteria bacterium]